MNAALYNVASKSGIESADKDAQHLIAGMRPGWVLLRNCQLGTANAVPVRFALIHPECGVALLDLVRAPMPDTVVRLRQRLDAARFGSIFPGHLPIVCQTLPASQLHHAAALIDYAFALEPPLLLPGNGAWTGTVQRALDPAPAAAALPPPEIELGRRRTLPSQRQGYRRGLLTFWVLLLGAIGAGGLVLATLGPPPPVATAPPGGGALTATVDAAAPAAVSKLGPRAPANADISMAPTLAARRDTTLESNSGTGAAAAGAVVAGQMAAPDWTAESGPVAATAAETAHAEPAAAFASADIAVSDQAPSAWYLVPAIGQPATFAPPPEQPPLLPTLRGPVLALDRYTALARPAKIPIPPVAAMPVPATPFQAAIDWYTAMAPPPEPPAPPKAEMTGPTPTPATPLQGPTPSIERQAGIASPDRIPMPPLAETATTKPTALAQANTNRLSRPEAGTSRSAGDPPRPIAAVSPAIADSGRNAPARAARSAGPPPLVAAAASPRCRAIIIRIQLGEEPTDADRSYLRSGCGAR